MVPQRLRACLLALVLVAAACSGGDDPELEASDDPTPTPLATQPTPTPTDGDAGTDDGDTGTGTDGDGDATDGDGDAGDSDDAPGTGDDEPVDPDATPIPTPDIDLSEPAFTEASKISTVGLDEIFFGMSADEAAAAAETSWETDGSTTSSCWIATPINGPVGVEFMVWNGNVERVDITTELITTRSGAGVGSTPGELVELFGDNIDDTDPGLLVFVPTDEGDAEFRIMFEITNGAVSSYRAGRLPMVEFPACP